MEACVGLPPRLVEVTQQADGNQQINYLIKLDLKKKNQIYIKIYK